MKRELGHLKNSSIKEEHFIGERFREEFDMKKKFDIETIV